jgi:hypothetical protein
VLIDGYCFSVGALDIIFKLKGRLSCILQKLIVPPLEHKMVGTVM